MLSITSLAEVNDPEKPDTERAKVQADKRGIKPMPKLLLGWPGN
jgi:hypothetical protein